MCHIYLRVVHIWVFNKIIIPLCSLWPLARESCKGDVLCIGACVVYIDFVGSNLSHIVRKSTPVRGGRIIRMYCKLRPFSRDIIKLVLFYWSQMNLGRMWLFVLAYEMQSHLRCTYLYIVYTRILYS